MHKLRTAAGQFGAMIAYIHSQEMRHNCVTIC